MARTEAEIMIEGLLNSDYQKTVRRSGLLKEAPVVDVNLFQQDVISEVMCRAYVLMSLSDAGIRPGEEVVVFYLAENTLRRQAYKPLGKLAINFAKAGEVIFLAGTVRSMHQLNQGLDKSPERKSRMRNFFIWLTQVT